MKVFGKNVRLMIPVCVIALFLCVSGSVAFAQASQTFTVTPSSLTFGVPFGSAASASQPVTINVQSGSLTFPSPATATSPFSVPSNSCTGTIAAPATCQINVVLTTSSTTLVTGTLTIPLSGFDSVVVNLSGAAGAIKLFDQTSVALSPANVSFDNMATINSIPLNLSCPAGLTAKLSQSPDGLGDVLVDNYVTLQVNGSAAPIGSPAGNVCAGGVTDGFEGAVQQDCFSSAYRTAASANQINGFNTDTLANQNSTLGGAAGGVPPIDISSFLASSPSEASSPSIVISLLDAGGYAATSSLFLVTNCTVTGVTPGGTVSGNPITNDPNTQTQTLPLDTVPGQNILYTTSQANSGVVATGVTPRVTDIGISQTAFSALVHGTSAAPAVCLRLTGEQDPNNPGQFLCKGFLIQCFDPVTNTTTGDNCVTQAIAERKLYDAAQFDSPDAPDGQNYLSSSCAFFLGNAAGAGCASSGSGPNPATRIGPGFLLGGDAWLTGGGCHLDGTLNGNLCPLDTLTQFKGAADPLPGSTTVGRNSVFVPVVNMPLPFTNVFSTSGLTNGWVQAAGGTVTFQSNAATYNGTGLNPPANGFTPTAPYSFTYGVAPASAPIPDTTYPIPTDTTSYNTTVNPNFTAPICPSGSSTPASFTTPVGISGAMGDGVYNIHYFTTDCAFTEELVFNPTSSQLTDATANWASFPVYTFGVDTTVPTISSSTSGNTFANGAKVFPQFSCADTGSGLALCGGGPIAACSGMPGMGSLSATVTGPTALDTTVGGPHTYSGTATDCAGNTVTTQFNYNVTYAPASVLYGPLPALAVSGKTLSYYIAAVDTNPVKTPASVYGANLSATLKMPAATLGTSPAISAIVATVSCTSFPCTAAPVSGSSCSVSTATTTGKNPVTTVTVNCNGVTINDLAATKSGVVMKITLPISSKAPAGTISTSGTITATTPISGTTSFNSLILVL